MFLTNSSQLRFKQFFNSSEHMYLRLTSYLKLFGMHSSINHYAMTKQSTIKVYSMFVKKLEKRTSALLFN